MKTEQIWEIVPHTFENIRIAEGDRVVCDIEIPILSNEDTEERISQAQMNAKLIVAAPEMLACLQKLDAAASLAMHTGDNGLRNFVELMLMNTKEAIKKATL